MPNDTPPNDQDSAPPAAPQQGNPPSRNTPAPASLTIDLPDEGHTEALARALAPLLDGSDPALPQGAPGGRIHLRGELGAGKTCFARALLRACGITGRIKSPSYALLETYKVSNLYFYHLDFYRFGNTQDWLDAGFRDILHENAVVLIEWPEQAGALLAPPDLDVQLDYAAAARRATLTAHSNRGTLWLNLLAPRMPPVPASERPDAN